MDVVTGGLIDLEIRDVIEKGIGIIKDTTYQIIVHTPKLDISAASINTIETLRDYNSSIGDYTLATFIMHGGDYIKDVHPYRDNLEISIHKLEPNKKTITKRYKLVIINNSGNIHGSKYSLLSKEQLNKSEQFMIEGQCIELELEVIRLLYLDGVYRNSTLDKFVTTESKHIIEQQKVQGTNITIDINMCKPDNTKQYDHIVIPTGTKLIDLTSFLQNTTYGIYNGGVGTYFQKYENRNMLFIFPLYDNLLFENSKKKIILYHVNNSRLDYIEKTYYTDGDIIKILTNSNMSIIDTGEDEFMDSGDTLISSDPHMILNRDSVVTNDKVVTDKNNHVTGNKFKDRRDGVNLSNYVGNTSNIFKHKTAIIRKSMAVYQIQWNHCNIDILYPGMPVCFYYEDNVNDIFKLYGILQSVYSRYNELTKTTSAIINIMVEKPIAHYNL